MEVKVQEVVAIIDRSGSMSGKEDDTIGGINSTFEVLKEGKEEGTVIKVSIKLFDHEEQMLIHSINLEQVHPIERRQYQPRGQTALLDAIGNTLSYFMEKKLKDSNAYDSCLVYVVTDGLENCSHNFTKTKIKELIKSADENYNIKVIYLAANQDAIFEASQMGIGEGQAINYSETPENVDAVYRSAAHVAQRQRTTGDSSFTPLERASSQATQEHFRPPRVTRQKTNF